MSEKITTSWHKVAPLPEPVDPHRHCCHRPDLTREQALKNLKICYAEIANCEARFTRTLESQHGWIGREMILEDAISDSGAYFDCARELERFLVS